MPSGSEPDRTRAAGPAPGINATDTLTFRLVVLVNEIVRPFNAGAGAQYGITLSEWRCILWVAAHPDSSGEETAEGTAMDRMTVSRSLRRLAARGLAERETDATDRKRAMWRLTPAGRAIYDALTPRAFARDALIAAGLDEGELRALRAFIDTAIARLRAENAG